MTSTNVSARPTAALPKSLSGKRPEQEGKLARWWKRSRKYILAVLALLAIGATSYALFLEDPVDRVKELQADLRNKDLPSEERREKARELRQAMRELTPKQRNDLFAGRRDKDRQRLAAFFKKSKADQLKDLDKEIDRMLKRQKDREVRQNARGNGNGGAGRGAGGPGARNGGAGARNGPGAGNNRSGGPGGFGGRGNGRGNEDQRNLQQKNRLDSSTPDDRAQREAYHEILRQRMTQRGVSGGGFPGRGPGR